MKKNMLLRFALSIIILNSLSMRAQLTQNKETTKEKTEYYQKIFPYWYVGAGYTVPLMFGDVSSLTESKNYLGNRFDLSLGYRFSRIFGLEFTASLGKMKAASRNFSNNFVLANNGMTYYPYTMVDGIEYSEYPDLFGFWDKNSENAHLTGVKYSEIYAKVYYMQFALQGVFNLNRMFMEVPKDKEQFLSVLIKPGIYLQKFYSQAYSKVNNKEVAPKINSSPSIGLGGDISLHFLLTHQLGLEISSEIVWINNQNFDGIRTMKYSKDDYIWSSGVTLIYKFGRKLEAIQEPAPLDVVSMPKPEQTFAFSYFTPNITTRKERSFSEDVMFYFNVSKWDLIHSLNSNQVEFDKIAEAFAKLRSDEDLSIERINIIGYASPEGDGTFNKTLSDNRAKAIGEYISRVYQFPKNNIETVGKSEDWEGLREAIKEWESPNKKEIMQVLNQNNITDEQRKIKLQSLGESYNKMRAILYPPLRKNKCVFHYLVRPFGIAEAVKIIQVSPEKLSAEEMIAVANQYPISDVNFEATVNTAFKFYPMHPLPNIYKALVELYRNDASAAQPYLNRVSSDSRAWNLMGVMYAKLGNKQLAEQFFKKAADNGDKNAVENMKNFVSH